MKKSFLYVFVGILISSGIGYSIWNANSDEKEVVLYDVLSLEEELLYEPQEEPTLPEEESPVSGEEPTLPEEESPVSEEEPTLPEEESPVSEEEPTLPEEESPISEEEPILPEEEPLLSEEQLFEPFSEIVLLETSPILEWNRTPDQTGCVLLSLQATGNVTINR
jgi:hypothetical protein